MTDATIGPHHEPVRGKPINLLAPFEHQLKSAQPDGEKYDADPVDILESALEVERIMDEGADHRQGDNSDRQVDIENPLPTQVIHQPSAQRWPQRRRQNDAHAEDRHRHALLGGRKRFARDGLGTRNQAAAADPLQDAGETIIWVREWEAPAINDPIRNRTIENMKKRLRPSSVLHQLLIVIMMISAIL